jgi:hypothetical protein
MLQTLGVKNVAKIVPMPEDQKPRDPVAENMAILMSKPVKAFMQQDHQAHIQVHQNFMQDPKIGMLLGQNPNAQVMFNAMQAHISEHAAYLYRAQVQQAMGVELPDPNEEMDPQAEFALAGLLAQASSQVMAQNQNEQAAAQAQQRQQDPLVQMQQQELQIKDRETKVKEGKLQLEIEIARQQGRVSDPAVGQIEAAKGQQELQKGQQDMALKAQQAQTAEQRQNAQAQLNMRIAAQRAAGQEKRAEEQAQLNRRLAAQRAAQTPKKDDK